MPSRLDPADALFRVAMPQLHVGAHAKPNKDRLTLEHMIEKGQYSSRLGDRRKGAANSS